MGIVKTCGPDEVMVVSGLGHAGRPKVIQGGRSFFLPCVMKCQRMKLNLMEVTVTSENVTSKLGVCVSVVGIAQVKVDSSTEENLIKACGNFLSMSQRTFYNVILDTLEGHQRAIIGNMTVEEIMQDRTLFSQHVMDVATTDLINLGVLIVSYTIKDLSDSQNYLAALGASKTADIKKQAKIGEAEARKQATIQESLAKQEKEEAVFQNKMQTAAAERDFRIQQAINLEQVNREEAKANLAFELQAAIQKQKITEENMKIIEVERTQQILVQEQEIERKRRQLESNVKVPAQAAAFEKETKAKADAEKLKFEAQAKAEDVRAKGEAEAERILALANAEAEQMMKKAEAQSQYQTAAIVDTVLQQLPSIIHEVSKPLTNNLKVHLVSSGGSELGCERMTGEVLKIVESVPELVEKLTGVSMNAALKL